MSPRGAASNRSSARRTAAIFIGGIIASSLFNVWFIIWPAQQVVMASEARVKEGGQAIPEAARAARAAGVTSRTNTLLSIPMLFFMGAQSLEVLSRDGAAREDRDARRFRDHPAPSSRRTPSSGPRPRTRRARARSCSARSRSFWAGFVLTAIFVIVPRSSSADRRHVRRGARRGDPAGPRISAQVVGERRESGATAGSGTMTLVGRFGVYQAGTSRFRTFASSSARDEPLTAGDGARLRGVAVVARNAVGEVD